MPGSPFKFLDSYTREDRAVFFGRDREIEEMYRKVFEGRILLVYGISGTGKTSLINCGLANKFEDSDWLPVTVRRGRNILESLVSELQKVALTPPSSLTESSGPLPLGGDKSAIDSPQSPVKEPTPGRIIKALQSLYLDHFKPVCLIFDQFEELFIFGDRKEREQFIRVVKAVVDSDVQCRFIFSIREEYLAGVTEFELTISDFLANRMRVEKMTRQHAVDVIEGPCRVHGIKVEEGFSEALLNKLTQESNEVELTYLQVFLDKIYRLATADDSPKGRNEEEKHTPRPPAGGHPSQEGKMGGSPETHDKASGKSSPLSRGAQGGVFSIDLLDKVGDVSDLLGSFLEEQISALDEPDTGLAILKSFVSIKGTKKQITEEELLESSRTYGEDISTDVLKDYVRRFVNLRILRDKDESGRYELRHDSLAAKIFEKITLVEKEILEIRQFIENAFSTYQQRRRLLSQEDLNYISPYEDKLFLGKSCQGFVNASKADFLAKRKAFRRITGISTAGFILIIVAVGYYYFMKSQGAKTKELIIKAALQEKTSPALSLETAYRAYVMDSIGSLPKKAIMNAYYALYEQYPAAQKQLFDFYPCSTTIASACFSDDGNLIYGWLEDNEIKVWDSRGHEVFATAPDTVTVLHALVSGDNKYIGVLLENNKVKVYSLKGEFLFEVNTTLSNINDKFLFDFSKRSEYLLAVVNGTKVELYDDEGSPFQEMEKPGGRLYALDISPDERFIATASSGKKVNVWYYNRKIDQFSFYDSITGHRDAVRSCQFNNKSDYILTSSDDSTIGVWNLEGYRLQQWWYQDFIRPRLPWTLYQDYRDYLSGKECNAVFSKDHKSIAVTLYRFDGNNAMEYRYYLVHTRSSIFGMIGSTDYLDDYIWSGKYQPVFDYQHLVPSANDSYIATVVKGSEITNLVAPDMLPVMQFDGIQPGFSPDGKYLICVQGNTIRKYVIDVEEIRRLVYEEKIFGELDVDYKEWITY